jgi:hypothetical protein
MVSLEIVVVYTVVDISFLGMNSSLHLFLTRIMIRAWAEKTKGILSYICGKLFLTDTKISSLSLFSQIWCNSD